MKTIKLIILLLIFCGKLVQAETSPVSVKPELVEKNDSYWQDYNLDFFGKNLFKGNFAKQEFTGTSGDYKIAIDDMIEVHFWGAYNFEKVVKVDKQGNIFLPEVGRIKLAGIKNSDLNSYLKSQISKTFNKNVQIYANLQATNKIRVFVSGFVVNPGIYEGMPFSSVIYFLDKAEGVDHQKGSYINVSVIRNGKEIRKFNLYNFITDGQLIEFQFHEGDVIHVLPKNTFISVTGEVLNQNKFEVSGVTKGEDIIKLAKPTTDANRVNVVANKAGEIVVTNLTIVEFKNYRVFEGDKVDFISQSRSKTIGISIKGEHIGEQTIVLPYGGSLSEALKQLKFTSLSAKDDIVLYRKSAAKRQKELYDKVLDNLEQKMLNYSPISTEEAKIHVEEVKFLTQFIEKARAYEPNGLLTIYNEKGELSNPEVITLEEGDVIFVPKVSNFVSTFGYVTNPSFIPYESGKTVGYYIKLSGGFLENSNKDEVYVKKVNGSMQKVNLSYKPKPGEEIVVMPVIKFKTFQFAKDILSSIYQIAVTTRIFLLI